MVVAGWALDALYEPLAGLSVVFPNWLSGPMSAGVGRILLAGFSVGSAVVAPQDGCRMADSPKIVVTTIINRR